MRKVHGILVALLAVVFVAEAGRSQSWPPGGESPSPITERMHLPVSRFVPSSKRWNLVWADQIVPNNFTTARLAFAATHFAATQRFWADQAAEFRAFNPNFLVIEYHLAAGLNPLHNSDCPDPKSQSGSGFIGVVTPKRFDSEVGDYFEPWLAMHHIVSAGVQREAMFQHYDQLDSLHRVWHQDPAWLMDLSNADWREYVSDATIDWMNGDSDEGCFFDVAVETNSSLYNPKKGDVGHDFDWWAAPHGPAGAVGTIPDRPSFSTWMNDRYLGYFQHVYKRFHSDSVSYLVIPNTDQMVTTVYDPVWTDGDQSGETIDGAMMEGFGQYRGQDMWLTLERGMRHITGRGKILIAQCYNVDSVERLRRTAMYMLIKNENSFLNILNSDGVEWYPEYEIDLGDQSPLPATLDGLRIAGQSWQSVWARDYARGRVLCNTSDAAIEVDVPLVGSWEMITTGGGGRVADDGSLPRMSVVATPVTGSILVPPSGGVILRRRDIGRVGGPGIHGAVIGVTPNPIHVGTNVHVSSASPGHVRISLQNMLGVAVGSIFSGWLPAGEHTFPWDAHNVPPGMYQCVVTMDGYTERIGMIVER